MYKKYQQNIWLARIIIVNAKGKTTYQYRLTKKLTQITGKINAINWMKEYYLNKVLTIKRKNNFSLVLELGNNPFNQFFLVIPTSKKNNVIKLVYANINDYIFK